jgi:hypothetical protein
MPQIRIASEYDITTQVPVMYMLEAIGKKLAKSLDH